MSALNFTEWFEKNDSQWQEQATKELKGKPFETLLWELESGITMQPYYTAAPTHSASLTAFKNASQFQTEAPAIVEDISTYNNQQTLDALKGGTSGLYSAKQVVIPTILKDVQLDILWLGLTHSEQSFDGLPKEQSGILGNSPFGTATHQWTTENIQSAVNKGLATAQTFNIAKTFFIDASWLAQASVKPSAQIAWALQAGLAYLQELKTLNALNEASVGRFAFQFAIGTDFYAEAVKTSSFLSLWSVVLNKFGIELNAKTSPSIFTNCATNNWSTIDVNNNVLRATTATTAAYIGGTNAHLIQAYKLENETSTSSARVSRNIQHVLQNESYLSKTANAISGSYLFEHCAVALMNQAWDTFITHNKLGNITDLAVQDQWSDICASSKSQAIHDLKSGKKPMIGVNKYPAFDINMEALHMAVTEQTITDRLSLSLEK